MSEASKSGLPNGWRTARVGEILKVRNGYAFKSSDYRPEGVPLIRQSDLGDERVNVTTAKRVDARFLEELPNFVVREGDLLIGMSGSLGKIARYEEAEPGLQNQRTGLLVLKSGFAPNFAKLVLKYVEQQIVAEGKGIAVQNVSASEIEDCLFPLAPEPDRNQIVAEIEKQFTRLEAGVAGLRRVQVNLKRYRAAVLRAACEGKLVPTEAELARQEGRSYETGAQLLERILTERRQKWKGKGKYKEPEKLNTTNLPPLVEGWVWCLTDALFCFVTSGSRGWARYYSDDGAIFLRIGNLDHGSIRLDLREIQHVSPPRGAEGTRTKIKKSDFLISITADVGMVAIVPGDLDEAYINQHVALARPVDGFDRQYLAWYLAAEHGGQKEFLRLQRGATKAGLGLDDIRAVLVPLPPMSEQQRIVAEIERRLSVVEELEAAVSVNLQRATGLRQSILQQAFEGKLFDALASSAARSPEAPK